MQLNQLICSISLAIGLRLFVLQSCNCSANEDDAPTLDSLNKLGQCYLEATYSVLNRTLAAPTSESELIRSCKLQRNAFQCIKELSKNTNPMIKRGSVAFVASRQRHNRKYCTNPSGNEAHKLIAANKCLDRKSGSVKQVELEFGETLNEIYRRNYTDSTVELKQLCCSIYTLKTNWMAVTEPECHEYRAIYEELVASIMLDELKLICEDDDAKMEKICNKLERRQSKRTQYDQQEQRGRSSSILLLYLFVTLGEPGDARGKSL